MAEVHWTTLILYIVHTPETYMYLNVSLISHNEILQCQLNDALATSRLTTGLGKNTTCSLLVN